MKTEKEPTVLELLLAVAGALAAVAVLVFVW